jgi:hypothetical protein
VSDARLLFRAGFGGGGRMERRRSLSRESCRAALLAFAVLSAVSAQEARAEVVVQRDHDTIQVSVENDTVAHVLEVLAEDGNFRYRSTASLGKTIGGSFSGSWGQVLSGILVGFDFVVAYRPQGVEVVVYEESGGKPVPASPIEGPQPQKASTAVEQAAHGVSLAPKRVAPRGPSEYDLATSNLSGRH